MMSDFICSFYLLFSSGVLLVAATLEHNPGSAQPERREVHEEDEVLLFKTVTDPDREISLYVNHDRSDVFIVTWMINSTIITTKWMTANYTKIFLDVKRNIWIDHIDETYEGKYFIHNCTKPPVELIILDKILESDSLEMKNDIYLRIMIVMGAANIIMITVVFIIIFIKIRNAHKRRDLQPPKSDDNPLPLLTGVFIRNDQTSAL